MLARLGIVCAFAVACAGSPKGAAKPISEPADRDAVHEMNALVVATCGCEDSACVEARRAEAASLEPKVANLSDEDRSEVERARAVMKRCGRRIAKSAKKLVAAHVAIADATCACKDAACTKEQLAKVGKLGEEFPRARPTDEERKTIAEAETRRTACVNKLRGGGIGDIKTAEDAVRAYATLADLVCACTDTNCLMNVLTEAQAMGEKLSKVATTMTAEQAQAISASATRLSECAQKITSP